MREVNSPTGIHYRVHETPADLAALTEHVARRQRICLDTELSYGGQADNPLDGAFTASSAGGAPPSVTDMLPRCHDALSSLVRKADALRVGAARLLGALASADLGS